MFFFFFFQKNNVVSTWKTRHQFLLLKYFYPLHHVKFFTHTSIMSFFFSFFSLFFYPFQFTFLRHIYVILLHFFFLLCYISSSWTSSAFHANIHNYSAHFPFFFFLYFLLHPLERVTSCLQIYLFFIIFQVTCYVFFPFILFFFPLFFFIMFNSHILYTYFSTTLFFFFSSCHLPEQLTTFTLIYIRNCIARFCSFIFIFFTFQFVFYSHQ